MSATSGLHISTKSFQIANKAIDYAVSALSAADPLVPFAMTWRDNETYVERFMQGAYDDSIEMAMRFVNDADEGISSYAVVWNGYVDIDGKKHDAVVAEVGDRASSNAIQLAQPYQVNADGPVSPKGELLALGHAENLLLIKLSNANMSAHLVRPSYATTDSMVQDVTSQPYAQMPVALICLAANLFAGEESERVTLGIRKLQSLEADRSVAMCHHVFGVLAAAIADGELMNVLPSDDIEDLAQIVIQGGTQVYDAIDKGMIWDRDAQSYFAAVGSILDATLTDNGKSAMPEGGEKLVALYAKATSR